MGRSIYLPSKVSLRQIYPEKSKVENESSKSLALVAMTLKLGIDIARGRYQNRRLQLILHNLLLR